MFCPSCRNEYVEGVTECHDCRISLVGSLPPESKTFPWPGSELAALLVIAGTIYTFILRNIGTFVPDVFTNLTVARMTTVGSFLASLTIVLFFASFFTYCIRDEQTGLRYATILAFIGSGAMSILNVKDLIRVFEVHPSPIMSGSHHVEVIIPWIASFFMLLFFIALYRTSGPGKGSRMKRASGFAVAGSTVAVLLRSLTLLNFILTDGLKWLSGFVGERPLLFLPCVILSFAALLYFFLTFYREQKVTT